MAIVLKPFPFAGDGHTLEHLVAGAEREFGGCTDGLVAEGYIALDVAKESAAAVAVAAEESPAPDEIEAGTEEPTADLLPETAPRPGRKRK
ncbi:hypothetical protein NKJ71_13795 [Mesorhizobium sp. M0050]|uniref:hypothetical protein n=1 Tax=Mesorhizobium sp. M0050 TaxID=2956861 RepID=UPI0033378E0A